MPPRIRARIDKLTTLRQVYVLHAAAGNRAAADTVVQVDSLLANVTELFRRLGKEASKAQRGRAQDEYDGKLEKLVAALDHDYLLDVVANPRLWGDPGQRIQVRAGSNRGGGLPTYRQHQAGQPAKGWCSK